MGLALLFSGQGTQQPGSLAWLDALDGPPEAAAMRARLADILGADWRARLADPAWAASNRVAQPLLTGWALTAWAALAPRLPAPVVVAGYSVGELAAFAAAGVIGPAAALGLAVERARCMDAAQAQAEGGLLSVQGLAPDDARTWRDRHGLALAIRLAPDRAIVGGPAAALDAAAADLAARGLRHTRLAVRVASHTPAMAPAATAFEAHLRTLPFARPRCPVVCNRSAALARDPATLAAHLAQQIAHPILWDDCLDAVAERGATCVLEIGPGAALAALWRERHPGVPARSVDEFQSAEAVVAWVGKQEG